MALNSINPGATVDTRHGACMDTLPVSNRQLTGPNALVLDSFGGSGFLIIAYERIGGTRLMSWTALLRCHRQTLGGSRQYAYSCGTGCCALPGRAGGCPDGQRSSKGGHGYADQPHPHF